VVAHPLEEVVHRLLPQLEHLPLEVSVHLHQAS
jgi:hypothetical protein